MFPAAKKTRSKPKKRLRHAAGTLSQPLIELSRRIRELRGVVRGLTDVGAGAIEKLLEPVLEEGEKMPDVRFLFRLMGRLLEHRWKAADAADSDRWIEFRVLDQMRAESYRIRDRLYRQMVEVRKILVHSMGSKRCRLRFGFGARTPRSAGPLAFEVGNVVLALRRKDFVLPNLAVGGVKVKPQALADALEPDLKLLEPLLEEILQQDLQARTAADRSRDAIKAAATVCQRVGVALEVLFTLGGKLEHAKRLRSATRRRARAAAARAARRPRRVPAAEPEAEKAAEPRGARAVVVSIAGWLKRRPLPLKRLAPGPRHVRPGRRSRHGGRHAGGPGRGRRERPDFKKSRVFGLVGGLRSAGNL